MHGEMSAHFKLSTLVVEFATRLLWAFGALQTLQILFPCIMSI